MCMFLKNPKSTIPTMFSTASKKPYPNNPCMAYFPTFYRKKSTIHVGNIYLPLPTMHGWYMGYKDHQQK